MLGQTQFEPGLGLAAQFFGFRSDTEHAGGAIRVICHCLRFNLRKIRQDRLAGAHPIGAAHGDFHGGGQGIRQVVEELGHFGAGLEAVARSELAAALVRNEAPLGDGEQRVVGVVIVGLGEERFVGGHDREAVGIGEPDQLALHHALVIEPVAQDLHVEPVLAESLFQLGETAGGELDTSAAQGRIEGAGGATRQSDEAFRVLRQCLYGETGRIAQGAVEIGTARQTQEVAVAGLALRQHDDVGGDDLRQPRHRIRRLENHRELHAGDGLDARSGGLLGKFQRPEQVVGVGECQRRLPVGGGRLDDVADLQRPFEQREGRVDMEVDETGIFEDARHGSTHPESRFTVHYHYHIRRICLWRGPFPQRPLPPLPPIRPAGRTASSSVLSPAPSHRGRR